MIRIKHPCNEGLCLQGGDEERWQGRGCCHSARSHTGRPVPFLPLGSASSKAKPQVRQGKKIHYFLGPLALSICLPTSSKTFLCVCVCLLPRLFIFTHQMTPVYLDLSLLKKPESIMISQCLKKAKKTPFPQDVLY